MKQQIEQLIDRLASKELRRGLYVRCKPFDDEGTAIYKEKTLWYVEVIKSKHDVELPHVSALREQDIEPIGHPILIGDVLEKIEQFVRNKFGDAYLNASYASMDSMIYQWQYWFAETSTDLLKLWSKCGFTKSLQSILSEAVWEEEAVWYAGAPTGASVQVPKQPAIRDLFTLLLQLFPKP